MSDEREPTPAVVEIDAMNRREAFRRGIDPGPRPDEMAAEIIHEPGTGGHAFEGLGDDAMKLADAMFKDRLAKLETPPDDPMGDGTETELAMYQRFYAEAAREHMEARQMIEELHAESTRQTAELQAAAQQRDFLMGQCSALIGRLAGAHVAAGFIDMAGAQGFALKETLPINQVLQQITAANAPTDEPQP